MKYHRNTLANKDDLKAIVNNTGVKYNNKINPFSNNHFSKYQSTYRAISKGIKYTAMGLVAALYITGCGGGGGGGASGGGSYVGTQEITVGNPTDQQKNKWKQENEEEQNEDEGIVDQGDQGSVEESQPNLGDF